MAIGLAMGFDDRPLGEHTAAAPPLPFRERVGKLHRNLEECEAAALKNDGKYAFRAAKPKYRQTNEFYVIPLVPNMLGHRQTK
jgi:hypothetical protein